MNPGQIYEQALQEADVRLRAAGFSAEMAAWVCEQATFDYPGHTMAWALAVAGDVAALCADPTSFDDGGAK